MKRTETEEWEYVEVYPRSGLKLVEFCREKGLNSKPFYTWAKRYASNDVLKFASLGKPSFLPLQRKNDKAPGDDFVKPPRLFSFKTQTFCLEIALYTQPNGADLAMLTGVNP